jgi:hypothetical protein
VVIAGEEDTSRLMHLVCLNVGRLEGAGLVQGMQERIDGVLAGGGLPIIAHPSVSGFCGNPETRLLKGYLGIEINSAADLALWDLLLAERLADARPLLWGFMSNDSNNAAEYAGGRLMLRAGALNLESVLASLRKGSFYWGTGPLVSDVSVSGNTITIRLSERASIRFISAGGIVAKTVDGSVGQYAARGDEGYVRIEVETAGGKKAGTQPLRVLPGGVDNPYNVKGRWYKGNLHTHSTGEAGPFPRDEVVKLYRQSGYDFLAITDAVEWLVPPLATSW